MLAASHTTSSFLSLKIAYLEQHMSQRRAEDDFPCRITIRSSMIVFLLVYPTKKGADHLVERACDTGDPCTRRSGPLFGSSVPTFPSGSLSKQIRGVDPNKFLCGSLRTLIADPHNNDKSNVGGGFETN